MVSIQGQTAGTSVGMQCHSGGELRGDGAVTPSLAGMDAGMVEFVIFVGGVGVGCEVGEGVLVR